MFTVLGAIAAVGGAIPLIKKSSEGQDVNAKPSQPQVDPITAVLQAAKTLSQSLPSPLSGHALSKATNPPSFLVPSHTPSPPVADLQVLAAVLTAARKCGLNTWNCQSIFVKENGLDVGIWVGPIDGEEDIASTVVDRLTGGKAGTTSQSISFISIPQSSDSTFTKALDSLAMHTVFSLPEKEGKQAFFLVGRNIQTNNWLAIAAASDSAPEETALSTENKVESSPLESSSPKTEEGRKGKRRRKRQKPKTVVKHYPLSDTHEQGSKDIKSRYDLDMKPANEWIEQSAGKREKVTRKPE